MSTDVRVGIVSWNTAEFLERALGSLPAALGRLSAEVVVVDNASEDTSLDVARSHSWARVVANQDNLGYARAMNQALAGTEARVLVALNPDTEAPPGSLEELVGTLDEHPEAGLVAPVLVGSDGRTQRSVFPYPGVAQALETGFVPRRWRRDTDAGDARARGRPSVRDLKGRWVVGAVHCIRRTAVHGEGPYSTRWFMYVEDIDLCWRLENQGWRNLLREDVAVVHRGNAAGIQRWGEGADLELASLPNIYEWLWSDRSHFQARASAVVNYLGVGSKRQLLRLGAALGPRRAEAHRWERRAAELAQLSRYHARAIRGGPSYERM